MFLDAIMYFLEAMICFMKSEFNFLLQKTIHFHIVGKQIL